MELSVALTTFNRFEWTIRAIEQVIDDERIKEFVIVDDASTDNSFLRLANHYKDNQKVRLIQQVKNRGMSYNKYTAVSYCRTQYVALWDSDNTFDKSYLDALFASPMIAKQVDVILCPEFARPGFDYRDYCGLWINKSNVKELMNDPIFRCLLNTCNYVFPRDEYLKIYKEDLSIKATDTIHFNYLWLLAGHSFYVVRDMQYDHLQHSGSGFLQDLNHNMAKAKEIENLIKSL